MRLLQHVAHVGLQQPARGLAEAARFVRLGAERLHHHVAAEGLLQNLVQLAPAGPACARLVRRMRLPIARRRAASRPGSTVRLTSASFQSLLITTNAAPRR